MSLLFLKETQTKQISTVYTANNLKEITTGNGSFNNINFEWLSLLDDEPKEVPVSKSLAENVDRFATIKNKLILDLPSEDSKIFTA